MLPGARRRPSLAMVARRRRLRDDARAVRAGDEAHDVRQRDLPAEHGAALRAARVAVPAARARSAAPTSGSSWPSRSALPQSSPGTKRRRGYGAPSADRQPRRGRERADVGRHRHRPAMARHARGRRFGNRAGAGRRQRAGGDVARCRWRCPSRASQPATGDRDSLPRRLPDRPGVRRACRRAWRACPRSRRRCSCCWNPC